MLQEMENQEDRTTFVLAKINSLASREEKKLPTAAGEIFFNFLKKLKLSIHSPIQMGKIEFLNLEFDFWSNSIFGQNFDFC